MRAAVRDKRHFRQFRNFELDAKYRSPFQGQTKAWSSGPGSFTEPAGCRFLCRFPLLTAMPLFVKFFP